MISGIINIHKDAGMTSFDVVAAVRRISGQRKVGHTGTLDPDATGVLPVCLGTATKVCDLLTDARKTYEAEMLLGVVTDTQDTGGKVLKTETVLADEETIKEAVLSFAGAYDQLPPMYSAKHVNGKRLYELARQGLEVERSASRVTIYEIEILQMNLPNVRIRVSCSRGTYIRTLIHDIGQKLGCGACMSGLVRSAVGPFTIEKAVHLEDAGKLFLSGREKEILTPADELFTEYPGYTAGDHEKALRNGNALHPGWLILCDGEDRKRGNRIRMYLEDGTFAALYCFRRDEGIYRPEKMFLSE